MQEQHDWMDVERRSGTYQFGVEEGRAKGRAEGRAALVELLFGLLAERGVVVDASSDARIRSCEDLSTLQRWTLQAAHVTHVEALFDHSNE